MRLLAVCLGALFLAAPAFASAGAPTAPVYDSKGRLVDTPYVPPPPSVKLSEQRATEIFLAEDKVADWLDRYPKEGRQSQALYEKEYGTWLVHVWSGRAGEVATGRVADATGAVTEAWTGPQVAWTMARGYKGAFGGRKINSLPIWLGFCAVFLLGLGDLRRPLSLRNLDRSPTRPCSTCSRGWRTPAGAGGPAAPPLPPSGPSGFWPPRPSSSPAFASASISRLRM
jgi:hypothetical protein